MPFLNLEPWVEQYFANVAFIKDVNIPVQDTDAYRLNPNHNWAYNKLTIAEKQGLPCGLRGLYPEKYPVIIKPVYNLRSLGSGIETARTKEEFEKNMKDGFMWESFLEGEHISTDMAVEAGKMVWFCHCKGYPLNEGTFDYWEVEAAERSELTSLLASFVEENFQGYTGMANFETIGGKIIEMHLRLTDQWPDLYGSWFLQAVADLYSTGRWPHPHHHQQRTGYSVVLFEPHGFQFRKPSQPDVDELLGTEGVSSIQLSFDENLSSESHSNPPGGFRVAIINGTDFGACRTVRLKLKRLVQKTTSEN